MMQVGDLVVFTLMYFHVNSNKFDDTAPWGLLIYLNELTSTAKVLTKEGKIIVVNMDDLMLYSEYRTISDMYEAWK
jgi:hypothetical protein